MIIHNFIKVSDYSGLVGDGWNEEGSFKRVQYSTEKSLKIPDILDLYKIGSEILKESDQTRLDIRCVLENFEDLEILQKKLPEADLALRKFSEISKLTLGLNKGDRKEDPKNIEDAKKIVQTKVQKVLEKINNNFESFALSQLESAQNNDLTFVTNGFNVDEIFELWGENFEWTKESIRNFLENSLEKNPIYGMRNKSGELIAAVLISDGESTEWSVLPEYQGKGLITPLLIFAHGNEINIHGNEVKIYAHLRYNRSVSPGVAAGMKIHTNNKNFLLENHVRVEGEYTHFVEAALDTSQFTEKILKACEVQAS